MKFTRACIEAWLFYNPKSRREFFHNIKRWLRIKLHIESEGDFITISTSQFPGKIYYTTEEYYYKYRGEMLRGILGMLGSPTEEEKREWSTLEAFRKQWFAKGKK